MENEEEVDLVPEEIVHIAVEIDHDPDDRAGGNADEKRLQEAEEEVAKENSHDSILPSA